MIHSLTHSSCMDWKTRFGILLWQICSLKEPFAEMFHIKQYYQWIVNEGRRPDLKYIKLSDLGDLMTKCWHSNPDTRPSFSSLRIQLDQILSDVNASRMCYISNSSSSSGNTSRITINSRSNSGVGGSSSNHKDHHRSVSRSKSLLVNLGDVKTTADTTFQGTSQPASSTAPWGEHDSGTFTEEMASSRGSSTRLNHTRTRDSSRM
jgi:hypothetical protein